MFYDNDHIRLVDYKRNNGGKWTPLMFINPSRDGLITNIDMDKKQDYINFNQVINLHEPIYYVINKKICDYYVEHINDDNIQIISDTLYHKEDNFYIFIVKNNKLHIRNDTIFIVK